jgi:hypothetical protein
MYLVSLFGFSFAILSMAEMSSMCVAMDWARFCINVTDNFQGSNIRGTVSVSAMICRIVAGLRTIVARNHSICG